MRISVAATSAFSVSRPERRGTVEQDVVDRVLGRVAVERADQPPLAGDDADELDLRTGEVDRRGQDVRPGASGESTTWSAMRVAPDEHLVRPRDARAVVDAERGGRVALRVEVDHQHPEATERERGGEVHGGRRLADPALLVGDDEGPPLPGERQHPGRCFTWNVEVVGVSTFAVELVLVEPRPSGPGASGITGSAVGARRAAGVDSVGARGRGSGSGAGSVALLGSGGLQLG